MKLCPQVQYPHFSEHLQGWWLQNCSGHPVAMLHNTFCEKKLFRGATCDYFISFCHFLPGRRHCYPPPYDLFSGNCREQEGLPLRYIRYNILQAIIQIVSICLWTFIHVSVKNINVWSVAGTTCTKPFPEFGLKNRELSLQKWPALWGLDSARCPHRGSNLSGRSHTGKTLKRS